MSPDGQLPAYAAAAQLSTCRYFSMADVRPTKLQADGNGYGSLRGSRRRRLGTACPGRHWRCNRSWRSRIPWAQECCS
ncbi:hypothetical protein ACPA9J_10390 [Pseudomonas aeruginosa]